MRLVLDAPSSDFKEMYVVSQNPADFSEILHVHNAALIDRKLLTSAKAVNDLGFPQIAITFNEAGTKKFAQITRENIGNRLAILIDGKLYSAPKIMMEICDGTVHVNGHFSKQEAEEFAAKSMLRW